MSRYDYEPEAFEIMKDGKQLDELEVLDELKKLEQESKIMKEALRVYALKENWSQVLVSDDCFTCFASDCNPVEIAQQALEKVNGGSDE